MLKNISHAPYNCNPNAIAIQDEKGWKIDNSFFPFILTTDYLEDGRITKVEPIKKLTVWTKEELRIIKSTTTNPAFVSKLADISKGNVFSADIPYLTNFLVNTGKKVYDGVDFITFIVFDFETANTNLKEKTGDILCCGTIQGKFDLKTFKIYDIKERILSSDEIDPKLIVEELSKIFSFTDFIIAHNIGFDLGIFQYNAKKFDIKIPMMSKTKLYHGRFRGEVITTPMYNSWFDTMLAADISLQIVPAYGLKPLSEELKVRKVLAKMYEADGKVLKEADRTMVHAEIVEVEWKRNKERVKEYCMDDVRDTLGLFKLFAPTCFIPAIQAGIPVDWIIVSGHKSLWEILLMRKCVEKNYIIPQFTTKAPHREGAYCNPHECSLGRIRGATSTKVEDMAVQHIKTIIPNVHAIDISSAYPNAIMQRKISPETVFKMKGGQYRVEFANGETEVKVYENGILPEILEPIINATYQLKAESKKNPDLKDLYQGFKAFRNSAFGFLGIEEGIGRFTNKYASALVTQTIREIIDVIIKYIESKGGIVVYVDTDGVYYTGEIDISKLKDKLLAFGEYFGSKPGTGFDIDFYEKMFFLSGKNYIFLQNGEMKMKGSSLVSNSYPKSTRKFLKIILDNWMKTGKFELDKYIEEIRTSNNPDLFSFSMSIEADYTSTAFKKLSDRFGVGKHQFYVMKNAPIGRPKPYDNYELLERFDLNKLDREWYIYHLKQYLLTEIIGILKEDTKESIGTLFD